MKDDEDDDEHHGCASSFDVDIGGDKKHMFVRSGASRHEHDIHKDYDQVSVSSVEHEGNGNGIGSFGGHVPVESGSESEDHDAGSFDRQNVRGSDPSSSRRRRRRRLLKHKRKQIPNPTA